MVTERPSLMGDPTTSNGCLNVIRGNNTSVKMFQNVLECSEHSAAVGSMERHAFLHLVKAVLWEVPYSGYASKYNGHI